MMIVITGGSGSGKSAFAEERVIGLDDGKESSARFYIATMQCYDEESCRRILRHRSLRSGKGFVTIEQPLHLEEAAETIRKTAVDGKRITVLLECMSNLAANEMFDPQGSGEDAFNSIQRGIDRLRGACDNLVVVTNEVFSDGMIYDGATVRYQCLLGTINQMLASCADEVVEVVYGIPNILKKV